MKLPSLSSLRRHWSTRGVFSIGQFRRWAFAVALLAAAVASFWTADGVTTGPVTTNDTTTNLNGPPASSDQAADLTFDQRQTTPATPSHRQFSPERDPLALPTSGVQQANYWQASGSQPVSRPAVPVPATYPDASYPNSNYPNSNYADSNYANSNYTNSTSPGSPGRTSPAATANAEAAWPRISPRPHRSAPASLPVPGHAGPAERTAPVGTPAEEIVIRPGHAPRQPSAENSSDPPIHVYPNRMGAGSLESDVPGQPPVHVFPESRPTQSVSERSTDGRPTSILPPHLLPKDGPAANAPRFGLTSQPRQLDPTDTTLILPPTQQAPTTASPLPTGRSFSSNSNTPMSPDVFAPPAFVDSPGVTSLPTAPLPSGAILPGPTYDLPVNPQPAEVVVPGESSDLLSWWERDITRPVFRKRRPMNLTLEQALGLSISEAPELQVLHSDWFIRQVEIARQDAAFDWTSFVDGIWNRDSVPVSSSLDGATNRLRSRTSSGQAGLRKLLRDGGELEFSQVVGTENSNSQFISPNNQGTSRLQVEWTHRLLRGGGEAYNSSRVRIAAIENDSSFDLFQEGVQDHLLNVSSAYWILVLRRGRFVQSVTSWNRAKSVADEMAQRVDVDVTPAMMDRARSEVADRLAGCIEAQHDVYRAQDALLRLIYGPQFVQYANNEIITQTLPMKQAPPVAAEPQIEQAIRNRSEVHRSIRNIKIAAVQYEVAEDEVLPVLDMTLTGYAAGLRGNNDIGGSIANQFTQGEPGVGIGFNFEMPYRNRAALAAAEQARVAIKRMQAELETTIANVSEDVRDQVTQRNKYGAVLRQQWESLARSRRLLKTTQTRRRYLADGARVGDLYLENLLQMQERLEQAESTYLQSQIRFAVADNALLRAVSMLDTLAVPTNSGHGPGAAVREAVGRKSSSHIDVARDPHLSGYDPENLDAVYEPPQPPIAR